MLVWYADDGSRSESQSHLSPAVLESAHSCPRRRGLPPRPPQEVAAAAPGTPRHDPARRDRVARAAGHVLVRGHQKSAGRRAIRDAFPHGMNLPPPWPCNEHTVQRPKDMPKCLFGPPPGQNSERKTSGGQRQTCSHAGSRATPRLATPYLRCGLVQRVFPIAIG